MTESLQLSDANRELGEAEFRELADNAPVMIWRSRPDKQCDWFNKPWLDYAGKSQEELFGYGWADDVHPDDFDRCVDIYQRAFDARDSFTMPYRLRRHDGVYRWFLDNGAPFYREGRFAGYFGSCTDITAEKELEAHQEVLLAELNHRVKNNLQLIISFLQLSRVHAEGDEAKGLLQAAISRIQGVGAVQAELHKTPSGFVDLSEYLPNLIRAALQMEGDNIRLTISADAVDVPFRLGSDLGLIVNELVTNAIKHGGAAMCEISFELERVADERIVITLKDNGQGFPVEYLGTEVSKAARARGLGIIGALAQRCGATLIRENDHGAVATLTLSLDSL
jgi:PAS domain S-box-containing protein